jgi:hypothetical protein
MSRSEVISCSIWLLEAQADTLRPATWFTPIAIYLGSPTSGGPFLSQTVQSARRSCGGPLRNPPRQPPVGVEEDDRGFSASVVRITVPVVGRGVTDVHPRPSIPAPARAEIACHGEAHA